MISLIILISLILDGFVVEIVAHMLFLPIFRQIKTLRTGYLRMIKKTTTNFSQ